MGDVSDFLKKYFLFSEPVDTEIFVLSENTDNDKNKKRNDNDGGTQKNKRNDESEDNKESSQYTHKKNRKRENFQGTSNENNDMEDKSDSAVSIKPEKSRRRDRSRIKKPIQISELSNKRVYGNQEDKQNKSEEKNDLNTKDKSDNNVRANDFEKNEKLKKTYIHTDIKDNLEFVKKIYSSDINGDFVLREFKIHVKNLDIDAFVIFFDGMIDRVSLNLAILQPLMTLSYLDIDDDKSSITDFIMDHIMPHNQVRVSNQYEQIIDEVNFGGAGLFVDGLDIAYSMDIKGWEHRTVGRPNTELVIRGPQEAFNENLRMNSALIRKIMKDEDVIVEDIQVGKRSKTPCSMVYVKDIANKDLVGEVRRRLKSISVDYITDSGEIEHFIEDSTGNPMPQMLATERPDRVASMLSEGRVAIMIHGSPFVLVLPVTFFNLLHSAEDKSIRFPYATFLRLVRIIGMIFALLLPGIYLAVTTFHQEMIPTDLLLAVAAAREKVPFPTLIGIIIMEVSFELIREAGIRIPGPIGPTLGIVGALILGQAAVAANLVSPILIIIVAVTGLGSFAIPDYSLAYTFRIYRFVYIALGSIAGLLGITAGIFIQFLFIVNAKSFGVPFFAPFAPKTTGGLTDTIIRSPIWKEEDRPDYLNPQDIKKEKKISRGWRKSDGGDKV